MIRHAADIPLQPPPSHEPRTAAREGFAALASRLGRWAHSLAVAEENGRLGGHQQPAVVVGVTSCTAAESPTSTIGPLAAAASGVFRQGVLIVESDPDCMTLSQLPDARVSAGWNDLGLDHDPVWHNHLQHDHFQHDHIEHNHIEHTGHSNVWLLRAAHPLRPPFEADDFWARLQPLRGSYGLVLVDLPPAGESEQGRVLAAMLDGVLLVVEAERTQARVAQRIKDHLETLGARLLGVVLRGAREHLPPWLDRRLP